MRGALVTALVLMSAAAPLAQAANTCLQTSNISNFEYPNDNSILVHMYGGGLYRNDLPHRCFGLKMGTRGITYEPSIPGSNQLCDNIGTFRVNDTAGETCMWGAFTKLK